MKHIVLFVQFFLNSKYFPQIDTLLFAKNSLLQPTILHKLQRSW